MLRYPLNPIYFATGTAIALILVYHWMSQPVWLRVRPNIHESREETSDSSCRIQDIHNTTLGFEKIFVVSLPSRTDRRDGTILAAALSDMEFEFIDGVNGSTIPDKALPKTYDHGRLDDAIIGAWRGHINAIREVVRRNLSTALIMEDDGDWDVRIRDQLQNFAFSVHALTQPLAVEEQGRYADATYPRPSDTSPSSVPDLHFQHLPVTVDPTSSPYGDEWDVLWLGHCGMNLPFAGGKIVPKGRVVHFDPTVPERRHLWTVTQVDDLKENYPDHTRVTHHAEGGCCSLAYAVTQKSARKMLYELALKDMNNPFDLMLGRFCEGNGEPSRGYHNCLTTMPSLFHIHLPAGLRNHESDISDHGTDFLQQPITEVVRTSVKMNAAALLEGQTELVDYHPDSVPEDCEGGDCNATDAP